MGSKTIITVASPKGGVGKTTVAYEIAARGKAILVDLDWDMGGATGMWGDDPETRQSSNLLNGLMRGEGATPRPLHHIGRPALVPTDPRLAMLQVNVERVAERLQTWAAAWSQIVIIDTHPGTGVLADGAMAAADAILVPTTFGTRELESLIGFLSRVKGSGLPLIIVPNRWHMLKAEIPFLQSLNKISTALRIPVAPPIQDFPWLARRQRRGALSLLDEPGVEAKKAVAQYTDVLLTAADYIMQQRKEAKNGNHD